MSLAAKQIIGVMLVKNEEFFIESALGNVVEFCDKIIVLDNMSKDSTFEKLNKLASAYPHIAVDRINDFRKSHQPLEKYTNSNAWVLGVDGDEIYDKHGLARLRSRILQGEFDQYWSLKGHMLHVNAFDFDRQRASGYGTPPSRSVTKLYNFGALLTWMQSNKERLHGSNAVFKTGYSKNAVLNMYEACSWDDCDLRCLHACFVRRSNSDPEIRIMRKNPAGTRSFWRKRMSFYVDYALAALTGKEILEYKNQKYRHGSLVDHDITAFEISQPLSKA